MPCQFGMSGALGGSRVRRTSAMLGKAAPSALLDMLRQRFGPHALTSFGAAQLNHDGGRWRGAEMGVVGNKAVDLGAR